MASYYYLVAQLPYLLYGQQPPMPSEEFIALASPWLSKKDAQFIKLVSIDPYSLISTDTNGDNTDDDTAQSKDNTSYTKKTIASGSPFIDKWREWERTLRLNLAKARAIRLGRNEPIGELPALNDDVFAVVQKAVEAAESPLEAELIIDRARWQAIEELQGNVHFSRNTVLAYLLKLLILERHMSFQVETGFSEYKSLYASIMEKGTSAEGNIQRQLSGEIK